MLRSMDDGRDAPAPVCLPNLDFLFNAWQNSEELACSSEPVDEENEVPLDL